MRLWEFTCTSCGCTWYLDPGENDQRPEVNFCPKCGRTIGEWVPQPEMEFKS